MSVKGELNLQMQSALAHLIIHWDREFEGDLLRNYDNEVFPGLMEKARAYIDDHFIVTMYQPAQGALLESSDGHIDHTILIRNGTPILIESWAEGEHNYFVAVPSYMTAILEV